MLPGDLFRTFCNDNALSYRFNADALCVLKNHSKLRHLHIASSNNGIISPIPMSTWEDVAKSLSELAILDICDIKYDMRLLKLIPPQQLRSESYTPCAENERRIRAHCANLEVLRL